MESDWIDTDYSEHSGRSGHHLRRIVVLGVGDERRHDDAAGLIVARRVKQLAGDSVRVIEGSGEPTATMAIWAGADVAIVCDAMRGGVGGGTVYHFEVHRPPVPSSFFHYTTRTFNIADTIERARVLGHLPTRLIVFGIEGENFEEGEGLSPLVDEAVDRVVHSILAIADQETQEEAWAAAV